MTDLMTTGENYANFLSKERLESTLNKDDVRNIRARSYSYVSDHFDAVNSLTFIPIIGGTTNFLTSVHICNVGGVAGLWEIQIPAYQGGLLAGGSAGIVGGFLQPNTHASIANGGIMGVFDAPLIIIHDFGAGCAWGCVTYFIDRKQR